MRFEELAKALKNAKTVLIVTHDYPDPDALAASWGLAQLLEKKFRLQTVIAYGGFIGRAENREMIRQINMGLIPYGWTDFCSFDKIAMVDCQPGLGNSSLPKEAKVNIIVDHHPIAPTTHAEDFMDIRTHYGATSTIVADYLFESGMEIDKQLATALYLGIKTDTQELYREASAVDKKTYYQLMPLTDYRLVAHIENPRLPAEHYRCFARTLQNATVYNNIIVADVEDLETPETVAEMADYLVRYEDCEWAFCLGSFEGKMFLSMRKLAHEGDCGLLMREVVEGFGSGGGHGMMAGGKIILDKLSYKKCAREIIKRFLTKFQLEKVQGKPLIK